MRCRYPVFENRPSVAWSCRASLIVVVLLAGCLGGGNDVVIEADDARMLPRYSYDYDGSQFTRASGSLSASVDTERNTGTIEASVTVGPDLYEVLWQRFEAPEPYQSGGAARGLRVHGSTGNGSSELPEFFAYLACFGRATVSHNGRVEEDPTTRAGEFDARLLVARGHVRDAQTGIIYNDLRNGAYDPSQPDAAWVNATGAQAILELRTETGELWYHFEFENVKLEQF